jgi:hypothetical protein
MSRTSKISALLFVLLVAGCASLQPPESAVEAADKDSVIYDY